MLIFLHQATHSAKSGVSAKMRDSQTTQRRFGRRSAAVISAISAASLLATACTSASTTTTTKGGSSNGTLTVALGFPPQSLNPGADGNGGQNIVQWLSYEPLIRANSDGTFSAGLASSWKYVGTGNKQFEMTIRSGAKFSDGTAVDAAAVAASLNYFLKH